MAKEKRQSKIAGKYNYTNDFLRFDAFAEDGSLVLYLRSAEFQIVGSDGKIHQPYQEAIAKWTTDQARVMGRRRETSIMEQQRKIDELICEHLFDPSRSTCDGEPYTREDMFSDLQSEKRFSTDVEAIVFRGRELFKIPHDPESQDQTTASAGNSSAD